MSEAVSSSPDHSLDKDMLIKCLFQNIITIQNTGSNLRSNWLMWFYSTGRLFRSSTVYLVYLFCEAVVYLLFLRGVEVKKMS